MTRKAGRPFGTTHYKEEYAERLPQIMEDGSGIAAVCVEFGIVKQTFYNWIEKYPEFSDAYEIGKLKSQEWWERVGRQSATGDLQGNATVWVFNMKNKFGWKDKQDIEHTGPGGSPLKNEYTVNIVKSKNADASDT